MSIPIWQTTISNTHCHFIKRNNVFFGCRIATQSSMEDDTSSEMDEPLEEEEKKLYAKIHVKIYKADGFPKLEGGLLAQVKKRCSDTREFLDPYVQIYFNGQKGSSSKKKGTSYPEWNEQITFVTEFPVSEKSITVEVKDDEFVAHKVIGTFSIDLDKISSPGDEGFLPTFGPCYVPLRDPKMDSGVLYQGRLLMALTTEMISDYSSPYISVETIDPISQSCFGYEAEFFLFACILEADMINRKVADKKNVRFSLQLGQYGREISEGDNCSTSIMAVPVDKQYLYLPIEENKPCLHITSSWPDNTRRMYISNILHKMAKQLEEKLMQLKKLLKEKKQQTYTNTIQQHLREIKAIADDTVKLLQDHKEQQSARTQLEAERSDIYEQIVNEVKHVSLIAIAALNQVMRESALSKLDQLWNKLKSLVYDPEPILPDIVVWMECESKRIGYISFSAKDIIYSIKDNERGIDCGKCKSFFFKSLEEDEEKILARVESYLWLGSSKHKNYCFDGLPEGYLKIYDDMGDREEWFPKVLRYTERYVFQLKAYLHQARSLNISDSSRQHPSCFARVYLQNSSTSTQVSEKVQNPVWDEMLIFPEIVIYGDHLPQTTVVIEILHERSRGRIGFLGRMVTSVQAEKSSKAIALQWYNIRYSTEDAEILAAFHLFKAEEGDERIFSDVAEIREEEKWSIPPEIRPEYSLHRVEILFWGLREMRRVHLSRVKCPRIDIECAEHVVRSNVIVDYKKYSNFIDNVKYLDINLPSQLESLPSLTIKLVNAKGYGAKDVVASHIIKSIQSHFYQPKDFVYDRMSPTIIQLEGTGHPVTYIIQKVNFPWTFSIPEKKKPNAEEDGDEQDWWSRYYISTNMYQHEDVENSGRKSVSAPQIMRKKSKTSLPRKSKTGLRKFREAVAHVDFKLKFTSKMTDCVDARGFVVYSTELEKVPEFGGFEEWLHSFQLSRRKKFSLLKEKVVATFKGCFQIYKLPLQQPCMDLKLGLIGEEDGFFKRLPKNKPSKVLIRAYFIKAVDLKPSDITNTTDAYIVLRLGKQKLGDRDSYVSKLLNPVFGKCFEFVTNFPNESILHVQLFDWDLMGTDDFIGETVIDLENRYYSRRRPICGLARYYELDGPNAWRDALSPMEILTKLCQENRMDGPHILENGIRIANTVYVFGLIPLVDDEESNLENLALCLLHRWSDICPNRYSLVPEHVETRTLYNRKYPGEPQGQLVMWLDMFDEDRTPPLNPRKISMRKPESFELRVIIWNTDEVVLADDAFFTGEKMSDIYIKGWLTGKDVQTTDVHYRSLTGEGNFNWRFLFPFEYLAMERQVVVMKKMNLLSWDETEFKMPPHLQLEVWDADHFSPDDCLGGLTIDLNRFPRGSKTSRQCSLEMLKEDVPQISLFKQRRVKGWWPFFEVQNDGTLNLTGKLEAEFQLLTAEEAEESPVGAGRNEPEALQKPKRPQTSFVNYLNPLKTIRYAIWRNYKKKIIQALLIIACVLLLILFFYALPGYAAKRLLRA